MVRLPPGGADSLHPPVFPHGERRQPTSQSLLTGPRTTSGRVPALMASFDPDCPPKPHLQTPSHWGLAAPNTNSPGTRTPQIQCHFLSSPLIALLPLLLYSVLDGNDLGKNAGIRQPHIQIPLSPLSGVKLDKLLMFIEFRVHF